MVKTKYLLWLLLIAFILIFNILPFKFIVNTSPNRSSMYPVIAEGEYLLIREVKVGEIEIGDIITVDSNGISITHRVQSIMIINNSYYYITKGDNPITNPDIDIRGLYGSLIPHDKVIGVVLAKLNPILGSLLYKYGKDSPFTYTILLFVIVSVVLISFYLFLIPEHGESGFKISKRSVINKKNAKKIIGKPRLLALAVLFLIFLSSFASVYIFLFIPTSGNSFNQMDINYVTVSEPIFVSEDIPTGYGTITVEYTKISLEISLQVGIYIFSKIEKISVNVFPKESSDSLISQLWFPLDHINHGNITISLVLIIDQDILIQLGDQPVELLIDTCLIYTENVLFQKENCLSQFLNLGLIS